MESLALVLLAPLALQAGTLDSCVDREHAGIDGLVPEASGIVWYGTWEDAMAEQARTGKPVMLHMGSPRCITPPGNRVPGTW